MAVSVLHRGPWKNLMERNEAEIMDQLKSSGLDDLQAVKVVKGKEKVRDARKILGESDSSTLEATHANLQSVDMTRFRFKASFSFGAY